MVESFRKNNRVGPCVEIFFFPRSRTNHAQYAVACAVTRSQPNKTPTGNFDVLDSALRHHHQSTKWGNIFWKNVNPGSRAPESCRIYAKVHWSCSGSSRWPRHLTKTSYAAFLFNFPPFCTNTESLWTCYDLSEFGVQVDGAGQEHLHISGSEDGRPGGEEDLKAADVSIDLQQRLHVLGGGDVLGDSSEDKEKEKQELM